MPKGKKDMTATALIVRHEAPATYAPRSLGQKVSACFAFVFFAVGLVGAFVPLLPTTVFWILACALAFRSSPKLKAKMMNHPKFGPGLQAWFDRGAISRQAKIACTISMALSLAIVAFFLADKQLVLGLIALCLIAVNLWIWSCPE